MSNAKRRKFTSVDVNGKIVELAIKRPNQAVLNEADLYYNVNLNKAIRLGSMTRTEAAQMIKDRQLWTDSDEERVTDVRKRIAARERQLLNKGISKERGLEVAKELKEFRAELISILGKKNSYLNNTAEYYAENIREQFLASACTIYADTEDKYFSSFDDYLNRSDEIVATDAYRETIYLVNGFDAMAHNNFAENKYLIENGRLSEDGFAIDEKGRKVTEDGKILNEEYRYVDDSGNYVDEYGNKINKDGSPIFEEDGAVIDEVKEEKKRGRKPKPE